MEKGEEVKMIALGFLIGVGIYLLICGIAICIEHIRNHFAKKEWWEEAMKPRRWFPD